MRGERSGRADRPRKEPAAHALDNRRAQEPVREHPGQGPGGARRRTQQPQRYLEGAQLRAGPAQGETAPLFDDERRHQEVTVARQVALPQPDCRGYDHRRVRQAHDLLQVLQPEAGEEARLQPDRVQHADEPVIPRTPIQMIY